MSYYVGIDLGGTNIKAGVVDQEGKLLNKLSIKTNAQRSMEEIIHDMGTLAEDCIRDAGFTREDIEAIGIGSPGTPDNDAGLLVYSSNLPFVNAPMRKLIRDVIDLPVYIDNDANCAAMAEAVAGAAKGSKDSVTITLGTGVGAGVIVNGRIYSGFNQAGSEFGHTVLVSGGIKCGCGRRGCFEQYASASAMARMTKEACEAHPDSIMNSIRDSYGEYNARIAFDAMNKGDKAAKQVVDTYIDYLSDGLANAINTFMPEILVIGGGVCNEGDALLKPLTENTMSRPYFGPGVAKTTIRLAEMGNDAGIVGAAMMGKSCVDDGKTGR
ncbi:MAG: ROK family protein [Saccharofermentans sp.]|jgi:glucokinase|nr:ROK family protein [Mageeibacillus sp.]MCI1264487.1 ROK family protein [Saccharofermentans sp.]MCI1275560.1 ROK family protein [Saccharofermentans sp.]MCI1768849.1 ROK family protein [Mageeibacillus sp.]